MNGTRSLRRRIGATALAVFGSMSAVALPATPAEAFTKPPQSYGQYGALQAYGGYGSGAGAYVNLADAAGLPEARVAFANSAVNSKGLTNIQDELGKTVSGDGPARAARAQGAALELNVLGQGIELVAPAQADAPPPGPEVVNSLLEVDRPPLAFADTLEGRARAPFNENRNVCIIGADMANSRGQAANVQLLGGDGNDELLNPLIQLEDPNPGERDVVNTISRQLLTGQVREDGSLAGNKLGVLSEVTQTVAPVTIADPTGSVVIAIEVGGVFQLRAFAGGLPGTGFIEYNPVTGGAQPVISITLPPASPLFALLNPLLGALPPDVTALINYNPATGQLLIPLGPDLDLLTPLVDLLATLGIVIGEQPRAIGSTGAPPEDPNGTASTAAIDLVRIQPIGPIAALAGLVTDVRVGHMEVLAFAPAGGIDCQGLVVGKSPDRIPSAEETERTRGYGDPVQAGETVTYTISVLNPYDCVLTNVRVQDDITAPAGIKFSVGATEPQPSSVTAIKGGTRVVWDDIGPIPARPPHLLPVQVMVNSATSSGRISDTATVTADCATGGGTGTTNVNFNLTGTTAPGGPKAGEPQVSGELPRIGREDGTSREAPGLIAPLLAVGLSLLLALAVTIRRRSRNQA